MSKLEKLIQQYCPDGVEWKTFSEVFETITDYTAAGSFKNIADNVQYLKVPDYAMLIRTTDLKSNFIKGGFIYVSESAFNYLWRVNMDKECIVMPNVGNCGEIYYVQPKDLPYEHCALAPNAILVRSNTQNNRYLSYCLQVEDFQKQLKKITSPVGQSKFNKSELKKLVLPIPPLPVQEEIVRVLDVFTELQAELQAELQKRKQQYNFYRDNLLTNFTTEQNVKEYTLGELGSFTRGNGLQKKDFTKEGVGCIHYGQIYTRFGAFADKTLTYVNRELASHLLQVEKGNLVIACTSENVEDICKSVAWLGEENICTGGHACVFRHDQNPKYISYFFQTEYFFNQKKKYTYGTKVKDIKPDSIAKIKIPLPSLKEQERIVSILDNLYTLTNDLTSGLPAEMEKRRQQYEFYRDKLLTFKRKEA